MNTLHIFNPSHEMAMADNSHNFQASKRVVLMERQLAALPLWWSKDGDSILLPDSPGVDAGLDVWYSQLAEHLALPRVEWVTAEHFLPEKGLEIRPWGWNKSLWRKLPCIKEREIVSEGFLDSIRSLSSRETAVGVFRSFPASSDWVGEAYFCTSEAQIDEAVARCPYYVLKALWSSSGRGVMLMQSAGSEQARKLCSSFLKHGGGLVIEPQYDKMQDFAMEFWSDGAGSVTFAGYSFFKAEYGRYAANIVAQQPIIQQMIKASPEVLLQIQNHLEHTLSSVIGHTYKGALGVDMMVVNHGGRTKVQPCVEINLRMNMGWLSLILSERLLSEGKTARLCSDYQQPGVIFADHQQRPSARFENGRLAAGYLSLTPVFPDTQFRICLQVDE